MKLRVSRRAAIAAAFAAATARVFLDLALDAGQIHNGLWIAALWGALPVMPYLLCLDAVRSVPHPLRRLLTLLALVVTTLDAATVFASVARTFGWLALDHVNGLILTVPLTLAALWCASRNGDAVGYAAMLWIRIFPALLLIVIMLQMRCFRAEWLRPLLGSGWPAIANASLRTFGCFIPATSVLLACDEENPDPGRRPSFARVACAALVAALLLVLRLMMAPTSRLYMPWLARLDALLTNGRAPLYLQLPMILTWFIGLLHLLTCECFAASALLQRLIPAINGRICAAVVVTGCASMSFLGFLEALKNGAAPWLFIVAAAFTSLAVLARRLFKGGERMCEN